MPNLILRRLLPCLLLCALLCAALSGCGIVIFSDPTAVDPPGTDAASPGTQAPVPGTTAAVTKVHNAYAAYAEAYLARIAAERNDFEGATVFLASPRDSLLLPGDEANAYNAALAARNQSVEETLHVRLAVSAVEEAAFADMVHQSVQADEYFSHLLLIPQKQIGVFAANASLMNLRSVPFLDLSLPYFDADSIPAATAGSVVYAAAGPASFEETTLSAVYFNRGMLEAGGLDLPYRLVYDGKWTWDAFFAYTAAVSSLDADGETPASFSSQYAASNLPATVFFSEGGRFVRSERGAAPVLAYSVEGDAERAALLARLFADPARHRDAESGVSVFHTGRSLFLLDRLYLMSWMPNSVQRWGILPFPKAAEEQPSYRSLASDDALFFAVQRNSVEAETASAVLRALNAASYGVLSEAYVDTAMNTLLRDNDSANMLELIAFSRTYDFAYSFGPSLRELAFATYAGFAELAGGTPLSSFVYRIASANNALAVRYG